MKKKSIIFLMLFTILTGCSQKTVENENINTEVGIVPNNESTEIYNIEKSDDDVIVLTPEILISLSEKHETLELEDFAPYVDLQPF